MCQFKHFVEQNEVGRISAGAGDGAVWLGHRVDGAEVPQHTGNAERGPGPNEHGGDDAVAAVVRLGLGLHQPHPVQEPQGE